MKNTPLNIAIIGGGISGSAAAWFLREQLGEQVDLTVYERSHRVGGRLETIEIGGIQVEAGGTIIHETNRYMVNFIDHLGLTRIEPRQGDGASASESVGVWNGNKVVFRTYSSDLRTKLFAVLRYGIFSPLRLQRAVSHTVDCWNTVYEKLESSRSFNSPAEIISEIGLKGMLKKDGRNWLENCGVGDRFIDEYVTAVGRIMYGQDVSMNAFATSIALAGAGLAGSLFSVEEGNHSVCEGLLRSANVTLQTNSEVNGLSRTEKGKYMLQFADGEPRCHDLIILATPNGPSALDVSTLKLSASALRKRPYQITWTTFVKGKLQPSYFGVDDVSKLPNALLTIEHADIPFSSLGFVNTSSDGTPIYKLFSREKPSESLLDQIFVQRDATEQRRWEAYPVLNPDDNLPPFRLADGLYWINAMEFTVSTMETEAMAAHNVTNCIVAEVGS